MRKYYYYTYTANDKIHKGVRCSENGRFDIVRVLNELKETYNCDCHVNFWHEISSDEYKQLMDMI